MALHFSITQEWNRSELVLEYKRATPHIGGHLNQAWSSKVIRTSRAYRKRDRSANVDYA